jgi:DNA-directed RNA polymerase subunit RPC12/RpoP
MGAEPEGGEYVCIVCGQPAAAAMTAACNWCGQRYHLNQRNDVPAKDCGQVWIDEQFMALQFACDNCLAGRPQLRESLTATTTKPVAGDGRARRYKRRA